MAKYTHTTEIHNLDAPREILPLLQGIIKFNSVIDVGCGLGTFLRALKENGIQDVIGIDGKWCDKALLFQNIAPQDFIEMDLEKPIVMSRRFDLAMSLEVAEHLTEARAASFVQDLTRLSDHILFSAAVPFQGGDHHINEQWLPYWTKKFEGHGYKLYDVLKPLYWDNPKIFWWYKQNMVLFIRDGKESDTVKSLPANQLSNVIHPDLFAAYANPKSTNSVKRYLRLLVKALQG